MKMPRHEGKPSTNKKIQKEYLQVIDLANKKNLSSVFKLCLLQNCILPPVFLQCEPLWQEGFYYLIQPTSIFFFSQKGICSWVNVKWHDFWNSVLVQFIWSVLPSGSRAPKSNWTSPCPLNTSNGRYPKCFIEELCTASWV